MLTGWHVILLLKVAVVAVTLLLVSSLIALAAGRYRLHGRINMVFFGLTLAALLGLEVLLRGVDPQLFDYFDEETRQALAIHLSFSMPAALLLPLMLYTGLTRRRTAHLVLATVFGICWIGTFITGVFFLPHTPPG